MSLFQVSNLRARTLQENRDITFANYSKSCRCVVVTLVFTISLLKFLNLIKKRKSEGDKARKYFLFFVLSHCCGPARERKYISENSCRHLTLSFAQSSILHLCYNSRSFTISLLEHVLCDGC